MKKALPFALLLIAHICWGQTDTIVSNKLVIKLTPSSFIDAYGGFSWRLGLEYKIAGNWAVCLDYGTYFSYGEKDSYISKTNTSGYFFRPQVKLYAPQQVAHLRGYLALEYLYKNTTFNYTDSIRMRPFLAYRQTYTIFKEISAFMLKCGTVQNLKHRFIIEWYGGVGWRLARGYNTLTPGEENHILTGENHGNMISDAARDVNIATLNLSLGFIIGYRLK